MEDIKVNNKKTVLGKTFNSEEERRNHFREELRKKLPELKQMEGFPIGEDEDILNLSDPPYYTACPNPWLNDFIAEWEEEKKQLEKEGKRVVDFEVDEPYAADVSEGKNNPIYTAHTYHTKVPHPAIMRYMLYYTQPGDVILDSFAGTGMTGVASQFCEKPDLKIKFRFENEWQKNFKQLPNWGKRHTICNDLSPFASFISFSYNTPTDSEEFISEADKISHRMIEECSWMYETEHTDGNIASINYVVWSDIYLCHNCNEEIEFWEAAFSFEQKKVLDEFSCKKCGSINTKKLSEKAWVTEFDSRLNKTIKIAKSQPVLIVYTCEGKRYQKQPDQKDLLLISKIKDFNCSYYYPTYQLEDGYNTRQPIDSHGLTNVHLFFTKRNLIALSYLNKMIDESKISNKLKFILTGMLKRSTKLNRIHVKNFFFGGGGWNAGGLAGTLYVPAMQVETSILEQLSDKIKSLVRANVFLINKYRNLSSTGSALEMPIDSNSVDYIFTDPPFGANIMYSELNSITEGWLKVITNNKSEAIENKVHNKSLLDYHYLMSRCFDEYFRVLKPGKWMTVEFSNTSAAVWNGIQNSIQGSGFIISNVSGLDKKQGGMRSITSPTAVKQDLVISCYKPSSKFDQKFKQHQNTDIAVWDFVEEHLNHLPIHLVKDNSTTAIIERSPKILFDRLIAFYVQKGLPVPIDAGAFQKGLRERFVERDGMFFTNEQVQEYDKKKAENPEFIQLSILVSSEQDGVLWLKNVLTEKSLAYQDIHPLWMQALAGVRKGDVIPELADMLEENFLKDEQGKWYVPDPENEVDLEKLRTKRLLKQFEVYKTETAKPKGKIKEVRVEALRAGFNQSYQNKDFKTIVQIGDRIPNNLLMEDEVLLQFYDIASSRV